MVAPAASLAPGSISKFRRRPASPPPSRDLLRLRPHRGAVVAPAGGDARVPRRPQGLRRRRGAGDRGSVVRGPGRGDLRPRRALRLRQDDGDAPRQPHDRDDERRHPPRRGVRPRQAPCRAAPPDRLRDPADRAVPARDHRAEHRDGPAAARLEEGPRARARRPAASSSSASIPAKCAIATRRSSRAGSASASAWPGPWPPTRRSCSWTSPSARSTPSTASACRTSSCACRRELRKTIVFVTHDIDEAIKMGDRIAVMQQGGKLPQYATPADLLMHPADDFVEDFVGADRALKRLALMRVRDVDLWTARGFTWATPSRPPARPSPAPTCRSLVVDDQRRPVAWLDDDDLRGERVEPGTGSPVQVVERDDILRDALSDLLQSEASTARSSTRRARRTASSRSTSSTTSSCPRPTARPRRREVAGLRSSPSRRTGSSATGRAARTAASTTTASAPAGSSTTSTATRRRSCSTCSSPSCPSRIGFAIAFALAVLAHRRRWLVGPITQITGILYTLPSVALFFLLLPITGRGGPDGDHRADRLHAADPLPQHVGRAGRRARGRPGRGPRHGADRPPAALARRAAARAAGDHGRAADRDDHDRRPRGAGLLRRRGRPRRAAWRRTRAFKSNVVFGRRAVRAARRWARRGSCSSASGC